MNTKLNLVPVRSFGYFVRTVRKLSGKSLRQVAREVGISAAFLSDIEHDRRRTDKIEELAKALDVHPTLLRSLDARLSGEDKAWLYENPQFVTLLKEMRTARPHAPLDVDSLRRAWLKRAKE